MNIPIIVRSVSGEISKFVAKDVEGVEHAIDIAKKELGDRARTVLALWTNSGKLVENQGLA